MTTHHNQRLAQAIHQAAAKLVFLLAWVLSIIACGGGRAPSSTAVQLVELYDKGQVTGTIASAHTPPPATIWRFDGAVPEPPPTKAAATRGWESGPGIKGLVIRDGRLMGSTTKDVSILHFERTPSADDLDTLHSIEVKLRASAGTNLQIDFGSGEKVDLVEAARGFLDFAANTTTTPLLAGSEIRTYKLVNTFTVTSADIRHIFLRPTDAVGATFEIESIRLVFRHEYLEGIASGSGWQGLSEIYHETIVTRSPEQVRFAVPLPSHPWLDLSIGTVEDHPITFRVAVTDDHGALGQETVLLEQTLTRAHRWERTPIDLTAFADRRVTLSFSLVSAEHGSIGFWGAPVIRNNVDDNAAAAKSSAVPRGVIVIWADTLRRDHLHTYGYARDTSPELDRMAREGVLFQNNVSQATWTKVATPSLLTSLYPATHGVSDFADRIPAAATTLAEVFRSNGRATLSMSSILFTGKFTNLHQGFEELHESGSLPDKQSSKTAREYVDRLLPWLTQHRSVPYFVFLHVSDPHDPFKPYPPYDTMWADQSKAREHERQETDVRNFIDEPLLKAFGMPTRADLSKAGFDPEAYVGFNRDWYDGSIRGMDAEIGRLLERLRSPEFVGQTLVAFVSDHGEEFLEHGRTFHGQSVYGELANTPLILWGPGLLPQGRTVAETVETIDVMPTILSLCGLAAPKETQGRSLRPLFTSTGRPAIGEAAAAATEGWVERPAFTQKAQTPGGGGAPPPNETESFAVTLGGWKLIHHTQRRSADPEFELFDAAKDPLNTADLAGAHREIVERLKLLLEAWRKEAVASRIAADEQATKDISPEDLERLRSLGYVQ